jgi:hypothetical protein
VAAGGHGASGKDTVNGRVILLMALVLCGEVGAQQKIEFTPFYGYAFRAGLKDADTGRTFRVDDSDCYGGMLDIPLSDMTQLEFFFSRQETRFESTAGLFDEQTDLDLDLDYYHIGGTYLILQGPWQPFVVGTVGATHFGPDAAGMESLTRFSIGLGAGLRYFPIEHLGVYLTARGIFTTMKEGDAVFRSESTNVTVDARGFWQPVLQAGLIFAF